MDESLHILNPLAGRQNGIEVFLDGRLAVERRQRAFFLAGSQNLLFGVLEVVGNLDGGVVGYESFSRRAFHLFEFFNLSMNEVNLLEICQVQVFS